jgi:UDP-N-acetyl-D-mannosaminuronic acid dehydrogenase
MNGSGLDRDIAVIGGCGHVGLPLALIFADRGQSVLIYDIDSRAVSSVAAGRMPFHEDGAEPMLERALRSGRLEVTDRPDGLGRCRHLILIVGTPVDEHLNPALDAIPSALEACGPFLRNGQVLILRSTVFPGTSARVQRWLDERSLDIAVAFCPERVAQGQSLKEFTELPQIVSAFSQRGLEAARTLFSHITGDLVEMQPAEAELAKLLTNAWRYIQFATANQFFMMAQSHGLDYYRILEGSRLRYPRLAAMPGPGFAAGPCLFKDTMQLAAFSHNEFFLGHAAMLVNEGLPDFLVQQVKARFSLEGKTAGILGMAFKAGSDDSRSSLSYKLKNILRSECRSVLCTDPRVRDDGLVSLERVLAESDVIFIGAPHQEYRGIRPREGSVVVDVWNLLGRGRLM